MNRKTVDKILTSVLLKRYKHSLSRLSRNGIELGTVFAL